MTVKGLSSLQRKLRLLPEAVKKGIGEAMEKSAQEIVDLARALVPIDDMTLYNSINWTWGDPPKGSVTLARSKRGTNEGLKISVYAGDDEAFYARWVEFGTAPHNVARGGGTVGGKKSLSRGGGLGHPGARPQGFLFPAYRATRKGTRTRITRAINRAAKLQAAKG